MTVATETRAMILPDSAAPEPRRGSGRALNVILWAALVLMCLVQLLPFWIAVTTAFKSPSDTSPQITLPLSSITWENFASAITDGNILRAIFNSVVVTAIGTTVTCVLGAFAAYPLARYATRFNKLIYALIVALIMVPPLSILVPLYTLMANLGGTNSYWGVIVVMVTSQLPLAIFLYAAFIRTIPISLEEAASIDGAGHIRIFFQVIFPLLKPVTATVIILTSVNIWNEYALSGYLLTDPSMRTIAPSIASFFAPQSSTLGAAAASSLIAVIPVVVAYIFLQQYFIRGMVAGAEK